MGGVNFFFQVHEFQVGSMEQAEIELDLEIKPEKNHVTHLIKRNVALATVKAFNQLGTNFSRNKVKWRVSGLE